MKSLYADRRRTQIIDLSKKGKATKSLTASDVLPQQQIWIGVTEDGLVSRTVDDKEPKHSGNDAPRWLVKASTSDTVYFVAKSGRAAAVAVHVIPQAEKLTQGSLFYKVSPLQETDSLAAVFALPARKSAFPEETCVITTTRFGMIKKSLISELPGPSAQTFVLVKVNEGDRLIGVGLTDNKTKEILLATAGGMAIRFKEDDVRPMGLVAAGVNGMKLDDTDEVVGMEILPAAGEMFLLTNDGKAKRVDEKDFPAQGRYGKGVIAWDLHGKRETRRCGQRQTEPHGDHPLEQGRAEIHAAGRGYYPQTRCHEGRCGRGSETRRGSDLGQCGVDGGEVCGGGEKKLNKVSAPKKVAKAKPAAKAKAPAKKAPAKKKPTAKGKKKK